VKFLFATTEVDKLPVTVLSRCQRFDLRRIPSSMLAGHFAQICASEGVTAEEEALAMVAAAAEGSVRDGLSILDQAIAHADLDGEGMVEAARVRDMLGLADKSAQRGLLNAVLSGDGPGLLAHVAQQFALGVEPIALLRGVMNLTHRITVAQVSGDAADAPSSEEREALETWAKALSAGQLHRLWQLLLKGHEEVKSAPDPLIAAQMALLRVMHAADLPDPGMLARKLEEIAARPAAASNDAAPSSAAGAPAGNRPALQWGALVDQVEQAVGLGMASTMRMQVRVVALAPGHLRYAQPPQFREDISATLRTALAKTTGEPWQVEKSASQDAEAAAPTLVEQDEARQRADAEALRASPLVAAALAAFPGAELIEDDHQLAVAGGNRNWRR
jgi:DNA polymerase-3 subunit gamma/tau